MNQTVVDTPAAGDKLDGRLVKRAWKFTPPGEDDRWVALTHPTPDQIAAMHMRLKFLYGINPEDLTEVQINEDLTVG